jgi:hypothetical protein
VAALFACRTGAALVNKNKGPRRDPAIGPGMVFSTRTAVGVRRGQRLASVSRGCLQDTCLIISLLAKAPEPSMRQAPTLRRPLFLPVSEPIASQTTAAHLTALLLLQVPPLRLHRSSRLPTVSREFRRARSAALGWREMKSPKSLFSGSECDLRSLFPLSSPRRLEP